MAQITCTINGVDYPVLFTMGAMLRFKRLTGKEVTQMDNSSLEDSATLIYCAVAAGAKANKMDFDFDLETFYDSMPMDDFQKLSEAVVEQYNPTPAKTAKSKKK